MARWVLTISAVRKKNKLIKDLCCCFLEFSISNQIGESLETAFYLRFFTKCNQACVGNVNGKVCGGRESEEP